MKQYKPEVAEALALLYREWAEECIKRAEELERQITGEEDK